MRRSLLNAGVGIVFLIVTGKLIAFLKDVLISYHFGIGTSTDAFFIAFNITSVLFTAFVTTISVVFLPLYNRSLKDSNRIRTQFSNTMITIYFLFALVIVLLTFVAAPYLVPLFYHTADPSRLSLATDLLRIMSFSLLFTIVVHFLTSIELSHQKFYTPHLIPIVNNTIVAISIGVLSPYYGIYIPALFGVLAWVVQLVFHLKVTRPFLSYKPAFALGNRYVKQMFPLFFPAFLGVFIDQTNIMVDTILASGMAEGSVSALTYANRLISFASGIFIMAIMSIAYPMFSKYVAHNDHDALHRAIRNSTRLLILVMVPIMVMIVIYHKEIVSIVFQRGKFDDEATRITASVFLFYGFGILFLGLRELFNKVFYAQKNTKTPLLISAVAVTLNIVLSLLLARFLGVSGLALASTLAMALYVTLQVVILYRDFGSMFLQNIVSFSVKIVTAAVLSSYAMYNFKTFIHIDNFYVDIVCGIAVGLSSFLFLCYFLRIEEIIEIVKRVK